jgi:formyl-CoA transferase
MPKLPLEGVRILEPAQLLAAPFATSLLGDFGAEVIKFDARAREIMMYLRGWFARHTREEVIQLAEKFEVSIGPVHDGRDILRDPHFGERGVIVDLPEPQLGSLKMVGPLPRFSETPGRIAHAGPSLGQHSDEVYREWLGLSDEELAELRRERVI